MEEIWKDIEGYEGMYQVSNLGRVKSLSRYVNSIGGQRLMSGRIRIPQKHRQGYLFIGFSKEQRLIHRMVATAFIPNPENKYAVNHKNGIKNDNRVENLEWVTREENEAHAFDTGLKKQKGECNNGSKLKNWQVFYIKYCGRNLKCKDLVKMFKVSRVTIQRIWNKKIWTHI